MNFLLALVFRFGLIQPTSNCEMPANLLPQKFTMHSEVMSQLSPHGLNDIAAASPIDPTWIVLPRNLFQLLD